MLKGKTVEILKSLQQSEALPYLCENIVELLRFVLDYTCEIIKRYLVSDNLVPQLRSLVDNKDDGSDESEALTLCLASIYPVFLDPEQVRCLFQPFQEQVCILQGSKDTNLAIEAGKVFRLLVGETAFTSSNPDIIWKCIKGLLSEGNDDACWDIGYKLWVRWTNKLDLSKSESFQELMTTQDYWKMLQRGVSATSYDHKKYSLNALTRSIQKISRDIDFRYMKWRMQEKSKYIGEWQRYTTLIEIIAIDTSLHQTEDSVGDLRYLMSSKSLIPSPWTVSLLSAGIRSPMETIRKFVTSTALNIPETDMAVFRYEAEFVSKILLPSGMIASNFVTQLDDSHNYTCPYAEHVTQFVYNLLMSLSDDDECNNYIGYILQLLTDKKTSYDPARLSIVRGLERTVRVRSYSGFEFFKPNLGMLVGLTTPNTETKLRQRMMFYLYIQILNYSNPDEASVDPWFGILDALFSQHVEFIPDVIDQVTNTFKKYWSDHSCPEVLTIDLPFAAEIYSRVADSKDQVLDYLEQELSIDDIGRAMSYKLPSLTKFMTDNKEALSRIISPAAQAFSNSYYQVLKTLNIECTVRREELLNILSNENDYEKISEWLRAALLSSNISLALTELWGYVKQKYGHRVKLDTEARASRENSMSLAYELLTKSTKCATNYDEILELASEHFASSATSCRYSICKFLNSLLDNITESNTSGDKLSDAIDTMWSGLADDRLVATERYLHYEFIEMIFSKSNIIHFTNDSLSKTLENLANSLVQLSYARRSILPKLSHSLYTSEKQQTKSPLWVSRVFTAIYCFQQIDDNLFRFEKIISRELDSLVPSRDMDSYYDAYGNDEVSAKAISIAYLSSLKADHLELFYHIIESEDYNVLIPIKKNDDIEERMRVQLFQIIILLERSFDTETKRTILQKYLLPMLDTEPSPLVRIYVEWISCRILLSIPDLVEESIVVPLEHSEDQPRILASLQRMGLMLARRLKVQESAEIASDFYRAYLLRVIALATSNRAAVRHSAVLLLYAVHTELTSSTCSDEFRAYLSDLIGVVENISRNAQAADSFKHFRSGDKSIWDIETDYTLVGICGGVMRRISDKVMPLIEKEEFAKYVPIDEAELDVPIGEPDNEIWKAPLSNTVQRALMADTSIQLQTKSGAWNSEDNEERKITRGELIVLASLVDKPPNLGGICRLSDVLGAQVLCMNDMNITKNSEFKGVAVTADHWMPMKEVKIEDIIPYMRQVKKAGYTLIGLEQTDKSVELDRNLEFPKKSLLLLGKEREGIPGDLLAELDFCVEIKQVGMIRSMNIQTATAVVVHAYSSQHC